MDGFFQNRKPSRVVEATATHGNAERSINGTGEK